MRDLRAKGSDEVTDRKKKSKEHVTAHAMPGGTVILYCGHCEGAYRLQLPLRAADLSNAAAQYASRHGACTVQHAS